MADALRQGGATDRAGNAGSPYDLFADILRLTGADADQAASSAVPPDPPDPAQQATQAASSIAQTGSSLDSRNPAGLHDDGSPWQGKIGVRNRLVVFDTIENGLRATALNLFNQQCLQKNNLNTVEQIIPKYATEARSIPGYISDVRGWMGLQPNQRLDLKDPTQLRGLLASMIRHENGLVNGQPRYSNEMLDQAVREAHEASRQQHPERWTGR